MQSWQADLRWSHWIGYFLWLGLSLFAFHRLKSLLPKCDRVLLQVAVFLSGWGILTIWRLSPYFGLRQTMWLAVSVGMLIMGARLPSNLNFLRDYKYLWLTGGLLLTAATLIFGTNPSGYGPKLWLGCCEIYLQPSEPLKLLLIVYLAAFLDHRYDWINRSPTPLFTLLTPILALTGIALLILVTQRDLGTATIFFVLMAGMIYSATGKRRILWASAGTLLMASAAAYSWFDVVRLRVDAWINPWADPSGRSYQIVQSLIAVANGGLWGRGAGMGSPGFVPVAHSDFIFTSLAEESGLLGTLILLFLILWISLRGMKIAERASSTFHRLLAIGISIYLAAQSLLIIGGNLRMLPLTGVTLPFISYGGSSLLTTFMGLLLLLHISQAAANNRKAAAPESALFFHKIWIGGFLLAALFNIWWGGVRAQTLLARPDNPRWALAEKYIPRGNIFDRQNTLLALTSGNAGSYQRVYLLPTSGSIIGYAHPRYGKAGLEAALDGWLSGTQGTSKWMRWKYALLYGFPPPGSDIRLTLDARLQQAADQTLGNFRGAVILLNAQNGEILAMTSHPTFDANRLDIIGANLQTDIQSRLLNRAVQGQYPLGNILTQLSSDFDKAWFENTWLPMPPFRLPTYTPSPQQASPLDMAILAATISNLGIRPAPHIVLSTRAALGNWQLLPPLGTSERRISKSQAISISQQWHQEEILTRYEPKIFIGGAAGVKASRNTLQDQQPLSVPYSETIQTWQIIQSIPSTSGDTTWLLAGTMPDWPGTPIGMAIVLEDSRPALAADLARELFNALFTPSK